MVGWNFNNSYISLPDSFYSRVEPAKVKSTKVIILNHNLSKSMGLSIGNDECVSVFAGNKIPEGSVPLSMAYAGHQYGTFTMLGDGRAILLGEQITPNNERYDIQLKGSGKTPYSRGGDGKAVVGPMLREYLISEAMYSLGIPTTRSLAVIATGETIYRERPKPGAVLTRVAQSHIRVGTFEYACYYCNREELRSLSLYTIKRHFDEDNENPYLFLLNEVIKRQAELIAKWQSVGFVHGVMNTDNMTISGETIDYGPCAFMDKYDPQTVFSSIDRYGRYSYQNQPYIAHWNLSILAESLLPLIHEDKDQAIKLADEALSQFPLLFRSKWLKLMASKLGLFNIEQNDEVLIESLLEIMFSFKLDYTNTFKALTYDEVASFLTNTQFKDWYYIWKQRLAKQEEGIYDSFNLMSKANPVVIPRNHLVEKALRSIEMEEDSREFENLLKVVTNPFDTQEDYYTQPDPSPCGYRTYCGT